MKGETGTSKRASHDIRPDRTDIRKRAERSERLTLNPPPSVSVPRLALHPPGDRQRRSDRPDKLADEEGFPLQ